MRAVRTNVNAKNAHSFTRSASVPETMEAAVATKTIWKNQSDIVELPCSTTAAAACSSPASRASSSGVEPWNSVKLPIRLPVSV